jgi:hypothetical protein
MSTTRLLLLLPALALALTGCSGIKVEAEFDAATDFEVYDTYAWRTPTPQETTEDSEQEKAFTELVQATADGTLAEKGLRRVSESEASLLLSYSVRVDERVQYGDPFYGHVVTRYEEGTLLFFFVDNTSGRRVWLGSGRTRLPLFRSRSGDEKISRQAVRAILAQFPPTQTDE